MDRQGVEKYFYLGDFTVSIIIIKKGSQCKAGKVR